MVDVDDALASGNSTEILQAQTLANTRRPLIATDNPKGLDTDTDGEVAAYGGDGAALLLRPLARVYPVIGVSGGSVSSSQLPAS
ncbi:hypothetical protein, partial [Pseudonocardia eucalypti]|uniref:hypothetical protein n=1 Tax=Pseudonocardia eucalypti TaxID=648755 RepID=UPI0031E9B38D